MDPGLVAVLIAVVGVLPSIITLVVSRQQAAKVAAVKVDLAAQTQGITTEVQAIHTAVNSERKAMSDEIRGMHGTIKTQGETIQRLELALQQATTRTPSGGHGQA